LGEGVEAADIKKCNELTHIETKNIPYYPKKYEGRSLLEVYINPWRD
jgi:hypothetical protein